VTGGEVTGGLGQPEWPPIILASASLARRNLLNAAGLRFGCIPAGIDETAVKEAARLLDSTAENTALRLARLKAQAIDQPDSIVIGCDQILVCDGLWYDKPATLDVARVHLERLRGRPHSLATATTVLRAGEEVWRHTATPRLTMRRFTDAFLEKYIAAEGQALLHCVGAYRLEGMGVHLFDTVEGDHSAILGLPLLPLLGFLRSCGMIAS
jgi:septum formation protein